MEFDFDSTSEVTFGVGVRVSDNTDFRDVAVDHSIQETLKAMATATWEKMVAIDENPHPYEPSGFSTGNQHLFLPIDDPMSELFQELATANQIAPGGAILDNPRSVFCYYTRLVDKQARRLFGIRRSTTFKGLLKKQAHLARYVNDELRLVDDPMFHLDHDFDLLVDSDGVHILHPSGFEAIAQLQTEIKKAVSTNIDEIQRTLTFVDLGPIKEVAETSMRAARLVAGIRARGTEGITLESLQDACHDSGVDITMTDGRVTVEKEITLDFLNALDDRRYTSRLRERQPTVYTAPIRHQV